MQKCKNNTPLVLWHRRHHLKNVVEINPRHRGAHKYIGEAYLKIGDIKNAEKHLAAMREICLLPCEELADLEKAIRAYRKK